MAQGANRFLIVVARAFKGTLISKSLVRLAGGAFPDGVTLGNPEQRGIGFAGPKFRDFVCAFTRAWIIMNGQKRYVVLRGYPVICHDGEGPVVSLVTRRYD